LGVTGINDAAFDDALALREEVAALSGRHIYLAMGIEPANLVLCTDLVDISAEVAEGAGRLRARYGLPPG